MTDYEIVKNYFDKEVTQKNPCIDCPYFSAVPDFQCTHEDCLKRHFVLGYKAGYNKALEDLKAPKTLAENRD